MKRKKRNKELIKYVKKENKKGHSFEDIHRHLLKYGYSDDEANEAIHSAKKSRKSNRKKFSSGIFLLILLFVIFFWYFTKPLCYDNSECDDGNTNTMDICINLETRNAKCLNAEVTELSDIEKVMSINPEEAISFTIEEEEHFIEVEKMLSSGRVIINIYSEPIKIFLGVGYSKEVDINKDGDNDLYIKLIEINNRIPTFEIRTLEKAKKLNLEIISSKDIYQRGEDIFGEFQIDYSGESFNGIILYTYARKGFEDRHYNMIRGVISPESINYMEDSLKAFKLNNNVYSYDTDYFFEEGEYYYTIAIYDCDAITSKLNKDCFGVDEEELDDVTSIKSITKTIKVLGGESPSECETSSDCTKTCVSCKDGTQICEQSSEKCMDCFNDFQCKSGYECEDNICIVKEEEPEEEEPEYSVTNPETILDCYSEDLSESLCSPEDALEFTNLFEDRLEICEISQGTFALGWEPFFGMFRGYEIQGEQEGNCAVKFWFLENNVIDISLLNKEMICKYDSSKRTAQGVNDCFEECCSGELVDAINEVM